MALEDLLARDDLPEDVREAIEQEIAIHNEGRFRRVFEEGRLGIAVLSADGRIERANTALCTLLGYSEPELQTLRIPDFTHPEDIDSDLEKTQQMLNGEVPFFTMDKRFIRKNGEVLWGRLTASLVGDQEGHPLWGFWMVEDITDRKRGEEVLRQSEELHRVLTEQSPAIIYRTDANGRCIYANPRWYEMTGLTTEETLGDGWREGVHPEDRQRTFESWKRMVASKGTWSIDYRLISKNGAVTWVHATASPVQGPTGETAGYVGTNVDITERKQAEEALRASELKYRAYVSRAPDGVFVADGDGRYVDVNDAACRMTGYSREELLSMSIPQLAARPAEEALPGFATLQESGRFSGEMVLRRGEADSDIIITGSAKGISRGYTNFSLPK